MVHVQYNAGPHISRSVFMAPDDGIITALQCIYIFLFLHCHSLLTSYALVFFCLCTVIRFFPHDLVSFPLI